MEYKTKGRSVNFQGLKWYGSLDNGENTCSNGKSRKTLRQAVQKLLIRHFPTNRSNFADIPTAIKSLTCQ